MSHTKKIQEARLQAGKEIQLSEREWEREMGGKSTAFRYCVWNKIRKNNLSGHNSHLSVR